MNRECYVCGIGTRICESCRTTYISPFSVEVVEVKALRKGFDLDAELRIDPIPDSPIPRRREHYDVTREAERVAEVEKEGFIVIRSTPRTLLLDLDDQAAIDRFWAMKDMVEDKVDIDGYQHWHSKSMKGFHVVVHLLNDVPVRTRLTLQTVLGSDPKRELLSVIKLEKYGIAEPSLLFQPPGARVRDTAPR